MFFSIGIPRPSVRRRVFFSVLDFSSCLADFFLGKQESLAVQCFVRQYKRQRRCGVILFDEFVSIQAILACGLWPFFRVPCSVAFVADGGV